MQQLVVLGVGWRSRPEVRRPARGVGPERVARRLLAVLRRAPGLGPKRVLRRGPGVWPLQVAGALLAVRG